MAAEYDNIRHHAGFGDGSGGVGGETTRGGTRMTRGVRGARAAVCGAVAVLMGSGVWLGARQSAQRPTFRSGVELVSVDAAVVDPSGQPVAGLGTGDFEVTVDGRPRRVVSAQYVDLSGSSAHPPSSSAGAAAPAFTSNDLDPAHPLPPPDRFVVLAIDHSSFVPGAGRQTLEAAKRFLAGLDASDRVALAAFPDPGLFVPPTTDRGAIVRAFGRIAGTAERIEPTHMELSIGLSEALEIAAGDRATTERVVLRECRSAGSGADIDLCRTSVELDAPEMAHQLRAQTARSLGGLLGLLENLKAIGGRKTLVLVSAGLAASSEQSSMDILGEVRAASAAAAAADTVIHALHVDTAIADAYGAERRRAPATVTRDAELMASGLDHLVGVNGGALFRVAVSADAAFARISREISAYYVLGVDATPSDRDGKAHAIDVRVPGRRVTVRHRQQFTIARPSAAGVSPDEAMAATLRSGQTIRELPVRVATQVMRDLTSENVRVLVRADIGRDVATPSAVRVGLALFDEAGQPTGSATSLRQIEPAPGPDAAWPFQQILTVRPGTYTLRLAARDADGRVGSVIHRVEARLTSGSGIRLSDLLLIDSERTGAARLSTVVDGRVRGGRLSSFVEVYPDRSASVTGVSLALADPSGSPVRVESAAAISARPQEQRLVATADLDLRSVPPGNYVVTATVRNGPLVLGQVSRAVTLVRTAAGAAGAPPDRPASSMLPAGARRFDRADVLRPEALAHFFARLRVQDPSGNEPGAVAAAAAISSGEYDAALRELASVEPASLAVVFLRGLSLLGRGEIEPAAAQFRAALRLAPGFLPAAFYLGACDAAGGRDEQAISAWQTTLISEADARIVYEALADAWIRLQDGDQALAVLAEARRRWPGDERFRDQQSLAEGLKKSGR